MNIMKNFIDSKNRILTGVILLFAILMFSDSCSKSTAYNTPSGSTGGTGGTGGPGTNEVFIQGMAFNPGTITVAAGTTVTWTNKDAVSHTVTSTTNLFDSGSLGTNGTFSYTFATAGSYPYKCKIHTYMTGTVTVN
jgi:plastocyanin